MEVRCQDLRFSRDGRAVVDVPSLVFGAGRTTALFGPNGSGKTTLLRLIAALERPDHGRVTLDGREAGPDRRTRMAIAFAFQETVFLAGTVASNLEVGLRLRGVDAAGRAERIAEAARECGIEDLLGRGARRLSGGEGQRVNLARALCLRAPLTLLDEPLARLDGAARARLLEDLPRLLHTFASTAIVVTHQRDEAFRLADDLVVLAGGKVRAAGPKGQVFRNPPDLETAVLLGYTAIPGEGGTLAVPPGGFRLAPGGPFTLAVEVAVDMGTHQEVLGRLGRAQVAVLLPAGTAPPPAGANVALQADGVVKFASP